MLAWEAQPISKVLVIPHLFSTMSQIIFGGQMSGVKQHSPIIIHMSSPPTACHAIGPVKRSNGQSGLLTATSPSCPTQGALVQLSISAGMTAANFTTHPTHPTNPVLGTSSRCLSG